MAKKTHFDKVILKDIKSTLDPFNKTIRLARVFEKDISNEHSIYIFEVYD